MRVKYNGLRHILPMICDLLLFLVDTAGGRTILRSFSATTTLNHREEQERSEVY
jgi:hypothetical protein